MRTLPLYALAGLILIIVLLLSGSLYVVNEAVQVVITQFGKPVGDPVISAGLHFKLPFIQKANFFERRWLEWDGYPNQIPTKDKKYIWVDTYARWRISDPLLFFQSVRDERGAHSRLDDILDGETRNAIASFPLIEIVRATSREMQAEFEVTEVERARIEAEIKVGRDGICDIILEQASRVTPALGIELVDLRIKRINYVEDVRRKVYDRMISERLRIAEKSRSEGRGRSAEIRGEKEKELNRIVSGAYRQAEEIKGKADGEAAAIYAAAYRQDPEFYAFTATLNTYKTTLSERSSIVTGTGGEFFQYLKKIR